MRGWRPSRNAREDLDQLALVDRAAAQLEVDVDVRRDRGGRVERRQVLGVGVDDRAELLDVGPVAQRLDAAAGGAGADGDHELGHLADLVDPLDVLRRGDRALDERDVVRALDHGAGGLGEVGDVDGLGDAQQLVLAVEQAELAAVAGGELPDGELRSGGGPQ